MISRLGKLSYVIAIALLLVGCEDGLHDPSDKEERPEPILEYEFHKDVRYYDESLSSYVSLLNDTTMFIVSGMPSDLVPEVGNVILCPNTTSTPQGFLRRVTSIDNGSGGMTVYTESATFEDAFYRLKLDQEINLADHVKELRDSLGNDVPFEVVSGDIWNHLNSGDTTSFDGVVTKAAWEGDVPSALTSLSIPVENRFLEGRVYIEQQVHLKIDYEFPNVKEVSYTIRRRAGVDANFKLSSSELCGKDDEDDWELPLLSHEVFFRTAIGYGPILFYPWLTLNVSLAGNADVSLNASCSFVFEHSESTWNSRTDEKTLTNLMQENENFMKLVSAELSGDLGFKAGGGLEFRLWNGDGLAFGVEAAFNYGMQFESSISMSDESLLISSDSVMIRPSLSLEMFVKSFFINKRNHRISSELTKEFDAFSLRLLPSFEYKILDGSGSGSGSGSDSDRLVVQPTVKPVSMMQTTEEGFALFSSEDPDTPLEHKKLPAAVVPDDTPPAGDSDVKFTEVEIVTEPLEFELPSAEKSYFVKPYVIAGGKHYYGKNDRRLVKRIIVDGNVIGFTYDSSDRLVSVTDSWHEFTYNYTYSENKILVTFISDDWTFTNTYTLSGSHLVNAQIPDDSYSFAYSDQGYLSKVSEDGDTWASGYVYENGNLVKVKSGEGGNEYGSANLKYSSRDDKTNLDLYLLLAVEGFDDLSEYYFIPWIRMPGISSACCQESQVFYSNGEYDFTRDVSYTFDEQGYVSHIKHGEISYSVEY